MNPHSILAVPAILLLLTSFPAETPAPGAAPTWAEAPWVMPRDQFGKGLAFRCGISDCGREVVVHVRAKLGFCDCMNGIADDDHLDQISDVDLLGGGKPIAPGRSISVGAMEGRLRAYGSNRSGLRGESLLTLAIRDRCDVIVATAVVGGVNPHSQEAAVLSLLDTNKVRSWAERTLGL